MVSFSQRTLPLLLTLLLGVAVHGWAPASHRPVFTRRVERNLFGGGGEKKEGGGGGGGGMGGMMNQFKQVQEIAKRTKQMQTDLEAARCSGEDAAGKVEVTLQGNTQPVSVAIDAEFFEASDGAAVGDAIFEALGVANEKAKTKMTEAVAEMYKGIPGMPPGGLPGMPGM